jgi:hypothetical protein
MEDILNILKVIVIISVTIGFVAFCVVWGLIIFALSFHAAAYTIALFHISIVEPVIFDTYSLFTIPYNDILVMANMYGLFHWTVTMVYCIGLIGGTEKIITIKINK